MKKHFAPQLTTWKLTAAILCIQSLTALSVRAQGVTGNNAPELLPPAASQTPAASSTTMVVSPLDPQQIAELTRSGLDAQIIADLVRERGVARALTVEDLLFLRHNSVDNAVIRAMQQAAPRAAIYPARPRVVHVAPAPPSPVIIRTVPSYYWGYHAPIHLHPCPGHPHRGGPPPRGGSRISFGFSF
jgi:hypothetical protein